MEKVKLKRTDLTLSPVIFGAWAIGGWMWGGADEKDAIKALHESVDLGITSIDTAPIYGFGLSEEIIGKALKNKRKDIQILTKFGIIWSGKQGQFFLSSQNNKGKNSDIYKYASKKSVINECEKSLKRLKTDYIDLYQLHWPDPTTPVEETMEALNDLLAQGKIKSGGVSNYDVPLLDKACNVTNIITDQVPYSMLKRNIEAELIPYCINKKIDILAYSPLQRGILTGKFKPDHEFKKGDSRNTLSYYKKENIIKINDFLEKLRDMAHSKNATLTQLVLKWTLNKPGISCVLAGTRDPVQLKENAGAMDVQLSKEDMQAIQNELSKLQLEL